MKGQSHKHSFIESSLNTISGFFISWMLWVWVINPMFGFHATVGQSLGVVLIFTAVSIVRGYLWRRLFNHIHVKNHK